MAYKRKGTRPSEIERPWRAQVGIFGPQQYLGDFATQEEAEAVEAAFRRVHGIGDGSLEAAKRRRISILHAYLQGTGWNDPSQNYKTQPRLPNGRWKPKERVNA